MTPIETRKTQLLARLGELTDRLERIEDALEETPSSDWEELATEREGDEVLEGMGSAGQLEMRMINAALARIDGGDYGHCARCGAQISEERLDVLPWTPFCRACAA